VSKAGVVQVLLALDWRFPNSNFGCSTPNQQVYLRKNEVYLSQSVCAPKFEFEFDFFFATRKKMKNNMVKKHRGLPVYRCFFCRPVTVNQSGCLLQKIIQFTVQHTPWCLSRS
jgi:hypothetical protein